MYPLACTYVCNIGRAHNKLISTNINANDLNRQSYGSAAG